jgi:hypothetical protein
MDRGKECKKKGWWLFAYDNENTWASGYYGDILVCWNHLSSRGISGDMFEEDKFQAWCKENNYPERLDSERQND